MTTTPIKALIKGHALLGEDIIPFDEIADALKKAKAKREFQATHKKVVHRHSGKTFILPIVSPYNKRP